MRHHGERAAAPGPSPAFSSDVPEAEPGLPLATSNLVSAAASRPRWLGPGLPRESKGANAQPPPWTSDRRCGSGPRQRNRCLSGPRRPALCNPKSARCGRHGGGGESEGEGSRRPSRTPQPPPRPFSGPPATSACPLTPSRGRLRGATGDLGRSRSQTAPRDSGARARRWLGPRS